MLICEKKGWIERSSHDGIDPLEKHDMAIRSVGVDRLADVCESVGFAIHHCGF